MFLLVSIPMNCPFAICISTKCANFSDVQMVHYQEELHNKHTKIVQQVN